VFPDSAGQMTQVGNDGVSVCRSGGAEERLEEIRSPQGGSMASYDEMSSTDRRKLFEGVASLSGFEEGPKSALPDGVRYEYDPVLKRTIEITPSGERFPVTLVDGKLKRDSDKIGRRKREAGLRRSYESHCHNKFI